MKREKPRLRVIHLTRKPQKGFHSFERLFRDIRAALPPEIEGCVVHSWCHSRGLVPRLINLVQAFFLRADVIHITGDIHYLALALVGRKVVITVHDLAPLRKSRGWRRRLLEWLWYRLPFRIASSITTISQTIRNELVQEFAIAPRAIEVIPNCINPSFTPAPKSWPDKPTVLMVGTRPQKNIERMAAALAGLPVEVCIIGTLTSEQVEAFTVSGVPFCMTGPLDDAAVLRTYRDCDLLAFASLYEGFGLPILEAQATGRPVLTSNFGSMAEVAGDGACLVDPHSRDSIRDGLKKIISDKTFRAQLIESGLTNARRFSPAACAGAYADVYRKTASLAEAEENFFIPLNSANDRLRGERRREEPN